METTTTIRIVYYDKQDHEVGRYETGDPWTAAERLAWNKWLSDHSVEHFFEPEGYDTWDLVESNAAAA